MMKAFRRGPYDVSSAEKIDFMLEKSPSGWSYVVGALRFPFVPSVSGVRHTLLAVYAHATTKTGHAFACVDNLIE